MSVREGRLWRGLWAVKDGCDTLTGEAARLVCVAYGSRLPYHQDFRNPLVAQGAQVRKALLCQGSNR